MRRRMQTRSLCVRFGIGLRPPRGGVGDSRGSRTSDESVCCLNLFTVDFKKGADKKVGRRFFDRKANGVSSARESEVMVVVFAIARRKQLCRDTVIEFDHDRG
jgi:hypothetical protein